MNESEKLMRMKSAENIANDMFKSLLGIKLDDKKIVVADCLHVGTILSAYIFDMASKCSNVSKEEILDQFTEALSEYVCDDTFEVLPLN